MHTSRLGKFVIVLAGAIGLLYVGGGHAHADTVSVNNVSVTNNSSASQSTGGTSASVITSNSTQQADNSAAPSAATAISTSDAVSQSTADAKAAPVIANSEVAQLSDAKSDTAITTGQIADTTGPSAPTSPVVINTASPAQTEAAGPAAYYPPRQIHPTVLSTTQNPPLETAHDEHGAPKPAEPTVPQGAFVLVSTVGAPSPVVKFLGGLTGFQALHHVGITAFLVLTLALLFGLVTSAFLSHLRASGYSIAPRGSTPQFNFAFPVGESRLSNKLKTDSLFSTPQRLLGGWWYQGGRI